MSIWAIADIHASRLDPSSGRPAKPMDVFGAEWSLHVERLEEAWARLVQPDDTVIVAGDIEWALRLEDAMETLQRLASWPGRKVLLRGNHDYWWSSKTTNRVRRALPAGIDLLHNDALVAEGFNICGAKGSAVPGGMDWTEENAKLLNREVQRLDVSLQNRDPTLPTIVALHFPPFYPTHNGSPYRQAIEAAGAAACVYGHLHGVAGQWGPQGCIGGVEYYLVAGDAVHFAPVLIATGGRIVPRPRDERRQRTVQYHPPLDDLKDLAENEMTDKRVEVGGEQQARELYDIPTESAEELAEQQGDEDPA